MSDEFGNDPRGQHRAGAQPAATPSERGAEAEPDALHDPVQAEQQGRTARDFGVTGAGASNDVGPLHRPPGGPGAAPGQRQGQERQAPPVPPVQAPGRERGAGADGIGSGLGQDRPGGDGLGEDRLSQDRPSTDRTDAPAAGAGGGQHAGSAGHRPGAGPQLLPHGERDKLGLRLQQAVNHFVDEPRRAVEEADHVLKEAARHVAETLAEHRRSLRGAWESKDRETETEELRVALRKYREVTERLLQM